MSFWRSAYLMIALMATAPLVACIDTGLVERVGGPKSENAVQSDWPRLADVETPPPAGVFTAAVPDPATGERMQIDLAIAAESAETRRKTVEGPVE